MKNKILTVLGAMAITSSMSSHAQLPTTDAASLLEIITGNQEQAMMHFAQQAWEKAKMEFNAESAAQQIDAINSAASNMVLRTTQTATDLFNIERLKEAMPAISACGTTTISVLGRDSLCSEKQSIDSEMARHTQRHATHGMTELEQHKAIEYSNKEHFERCRSLSGGDLSENACTSAASIFGMSGDTLSPADAEATQGFIDLMVGVAPDMKSLPRDPENMTAEEVARYNRESKREGYRSIVAGAFQALKAERESPDAANYMPSKLHRLKAFSADRWGDEEWVQNMQNTNPDNKNGVMETQILREIVVMDAFKIHLDTLQYEQSLRDYTLQASMLSLLKDKL